MTTELVSIHGGHSGQFCSHARDSLEEIVLRYIQKGFAWVGITEHMPPVDDRFLYPEELEAGLDAASIARRFDRYFAEGRRLQARYAGDIDLLIGFETEVYSGAMTKARQLIEAYQPDYVLGGIHHVDDLAIDYSVEAYRRAAEAAGGIEALYCRYFDQQLELIETLAPPVIAHFDLIRIFDPDYRQRWRQPAIARRIRRNLERIAQRRMILDFNVAALRKGADEPYLSEPLLGLAIELQIPLVPGDDSHSADTAGAYVAEGADLLRAAGYSERWKRPAGQDRPGPAATP
jgi:histidinol-phosphatase (PHP family)